MSRGAGLARQLQLMRILETRQEICVPAVAEELGFTVRTVYRDLQVLERVGVPIYQDRRGRRARWRVVEGYRRKLSLTLSQPELLALMLAVKLTGRIGLPGLRETAGSALRKLVAAVPEEVAQPVSRLESAVTVECGAGLEPSVEGAFEALTAAIGRSETVQLRYRRAGAKAARRRNVDPYQLHFAGGFVYLAAFCHRRNAVRTFRLDRMEQVMRTGAFYGAKAPHQLGLFGELPVSFDSERG